MTIASIDIGSNTTLMLISKFHPDTQVLSTIANYYEVPRVSEGLKCGSKIDENKIKILLDVLDKYKNIAQQLNCDSILIKATNAFRIASNAEDIIKFIFNSSGLHIEVIPGDEEARLTFLGTAFPFTNMLQQNVIDIGGGSTELINGSYNKIDFIKSFDTGVVSLTEKYLLHNPPSEIEINNSCRFLENIFFEINNNSIKAYKTIAVAGTPTTLSCIKQNIKNYDEEKVENSTLTLDDINSIIFQLRQLNSKEILNRYGQVVQGREDVLLAGCLILKNIMQILNLKEITVSNKGLRYGIVIDYLIKNNLIRT